jgi:hypothetical protein
MNASTRAILRSLVPVICPPEAVPYADAIVDHVGLTLSVAPPVLGKGLAAGLLTYDLGALPRYFKRARSLTGEKAERYFQSWEHGPTPVHVQLAKAVNQLVSLACYEQPAMMERVGYRPAPWIAEVTRKRLTVFAKDVDKQAAAILAPDPLRPAIPRRAYGRR